MGKNVQGESFLRRVQKKAQMPGISETMLPAVGTLETVEEKAGQVGFTHIQSPVTKKLGEIASDSRPRHMPTTDEVKDAYGEVELKMSSNSRKKEKKRAEAERRYNQQMEFSRKAVAVVPLNDPAVVQARFQALDVNSLMHQDSGKTAYERYIAKYDEIRTELEYIGEYETYVQDRVTRVLPRLQPNDPEIENIRKEQAKLKALYDVRTYYSVLGDMLRNKYYALLPQDEMEKLSYFELRRRLKKLYDAGYDQNPELIKYYQNLIRLKELDLTKEGKAKKREERYLKELDPAPAQAEDKRDPVKVLKNMGKLYKKLIDYTDSGKTLCDAGTIIMYKRKFLETHKADFDKFKNKPKVDLSKEPLFTLNTAFQDYDADRLTMPAAGDGLRTVLQAKKPQFDSEVVRDTSATAGIQLKPEQKESVREIGAYIFELGIEKDKIPFANSILQAPPDQQLIMFYLLEVGHGSASLDASFFVALNNYKPDLENIRKYSSFDDMSKAMRMAIRLQPQLAAYGRIQQDISQADGDVDYDKKPGDPQQKNRSFAQKKKSVMDAIVGRGQLLRLLYRNSGLHEDMPPDMVADPVMRKKIIDEYVKIGELCGRLKEIVIAERAANPNAAPTDPQTDYSANDVRSDTAVIPDAQKHLDMVDTDTEGIDAFNEYAMEDFFGSVDKLMIALTDGKLGMLNAGSGMITGFTGILGTVGLIMNTIAYTRAMDGFTTADATARGFDLGGDMLGVTGSFLFSGASFTDLAHAADTAAQLTTSAGVFAAVAGAVKVGVSTTQLIRAGLADTELDISHQRLGATLALKRARHRPITPDEERLQRFISHQQREIQVQEGSAAMGVVTGAMSAISGGLMISGAGAPAGAILGIVTVGVDLITKLSCWGARKHNRNVTVDEYLHIDEAVTEVKTNHPDPEIRDKKEKDLKDMVREEMLAMMGFSSKSDCFRFICEQMAETLYKEGVENPGGDLMYQRAVDSLNLRVDRINHKPSYDAIFTELMSHGG